MNFRRSRRPPSRGRPSEPPTASPLGELVSRYAERDRHAACERLSFYANQLSLADALEITSTWRDEEGHLEARQRRLPPEVRRLGGERIRGLELIEASCFKEIMALVEVKLGDIRGLGDVAVYDVALRIGAMLGLPPENVYLHASAHAGARALGIRTGERSLPREAFPPELSRLHAWEIESFLSRYHVELSSMNAVRRAA